MTAASRRAPHGLTTRSTVVFTASDTLCRTSAAVPGLLNLLVNFRTSDMFAALVKIHSGLRACRGTGSCVTARCEEAQQLRVGEAGPTLSADDGGNDDGEAREC